MNILKFSNLGSARHLQSGMEDAYTDKKNIILSSYENSN